MRVSKRPKTKRTEQLAQFQEARAFFEANRERLLAQYEGKYIAILGEEVIDADDDFSLLAERVFRREGVRDIFMPKVEEDTEAVNIPSPRALMRTPSHTRESGYPCGEDFPGFPPARE